jgi:type I restriction-modification system DNA methylase subunit
MDHSTHNKIVSFIWSIADDCLRDVFVRGKYRDVILPMFVLRRLDCLLEPSKTIMLEEVRFQREDAGIVDLEPHGLRDASGYVFYNTSRFTLKSLLGNPSQLEAICKSDMMIKGNDPENIKFGSTLATDDFSGTRFDFMLTNPPYGKSWKSDQKSIVDGKDVIDHRFQVNLSDYTGHEHDRGAGTFAPESLQLEAG